MQLRNGGGLCETSFAVNLVSLLDLSHHCQGQMYNLFCYFSVGSLSFLLVLNHCFHCSVPGTSEPVHLEETTTFTALLLPLIEGMGSDNTVIN